MRYVSISTYAKMVGINRVSVYKRIKKGTAVLLEDSEVPVIDLKLSRGKMVRNDFKAIAQFNALVATMADADKHCLIPQIQSQMVGEDRRKKA